MKEGNGKKASTNDKTKNKWAGTIRYKEELILTIATYIISGREEDRTETQHQFTQEAGLRVLEDLHALERVQVHVDGDLRLQLVRQQAQCFVFIRGFVTHPQIVKPFDDTVLQF